MIVNINTFTDADFTQAFVYQTALGVPIDITGKTLHLQARTAADDPTVFLEATTENNRITVTNAALGAFTLSVGESFLLTLPVGTYVHSLLLISGTTRTEVWRGTLTHAAGPTRF